MVCPDVPCLPISTERAACHRVRVYRAIRARVWCAVLALMLAVLVMSVGSIFLTVGLTAHTHDTLRLRGPSNNDQAVHAHISQQARSKYLIIGFTGLSIGAAMFIIFFVSVCIIFKHKFEDDEACGPEVLVEPQELSEYMKARYEGNIFTDNVDCLV